MNGLARGANKQVLVGVQKTEDKEQRKNKKDQINNNNNSNNNYNK